MDHELLAAQLRQTLGSRIRQITVKNPRRLYVDVAPADVAEAARIVHKELGARLSIATGLDMAVDFEILYHFAFDADPPPGIMVTLRVHLDHDAPVVDSITPGVPAAAWIEREMHELLGIEFRNHPDMRRLLLSDDWPEGVYPLRRGRPWEGKVEKRL